MSDKSSCNQSNSFLTQMKYYDEKGEIQIARMDWILMRAATFRDLIKETKRILGLGAVVLWLETGKHLGKQFAEGILEGEAELEEVPRLLELFFTQAGWGKIKAKVNFAEKEVVVAIENCATSRQTKSKEAICHFIRGYIAGICDAVFNAPTECSETKCMAKGDSLCDFQVKKSLG